MDRSRLRPGMVTPPSSRLPLDRLGLGRLLVGADEGLHALLGQRPLEAHHVDVSTRNVFVSMRATCVPAFVFTKGSVSPGRLPAALPRCRCRTIEDGTSMQKAERPAAFSACTKVSDEPGFFVYSV